MYNFTIGRVYTRYTLSDGEEHQHNLISSPTEISIEPQALEIGGYYNIIFYTGYNQQGSLILLHFPIKLSDRHVHTCMLV